MRLGLRLAALALAVLATGATRAAPAGGVFYQILVRSFRDTNGDGIGDLDGVRQSLPYLKSLGVTSILLTPIQPSPFYHNYFPSRFGGIDPALGDMARFRRLVRAIHRNGMRIYLDQEFQYVAEGHPCLLKAALAIPSKPNRLLTSAPGRLEPVFPGLERLPSWDGRRFIVATVDLKQPANRDYFTRLLLSWVHEGVDGFRVDHMMDDLDNRGLQTNLFASFWRPIFARLKAANPKLTIIAEQADWRYGEDWLDSGRRRTWCSAFPLRRRR